MKRSKTQKILEHLQTHERGITSMTAFSRYRTTRLSSIIFELRSRGYQIVTIEEKAEDGIRYGRYVLVGKESA